MTFRERNGAGLAALLFDGQSGRVSMPRKGTMKHDILHDPLGKPWMLRLPRRQRGENNRTRAWSRFAIVMPPRPSRVSAKAEMTTAGGGLAIGGSGTVFVFR